MILWVRWAALVAHVEGRRRILDALEAGALGKNPMAQARSIISTNRATGAGAAGRQAGRDPAAMSDQAKWAMNAAINRSEDDSASASQHIHSYVSRACSNSRRLATDFAATGIHTQPRQPVGAFSWVRPFFRSKDR